MTRSLRIEKVPASTLVCIKWNGGGEIPAELSGHYTSHDAAKLAIEVWKAKNARPDVKEESPSTDEAANKTVKAKGEPKPII